MILRNEFVSLMYPMNFIVCLRSSFSSVRLWLLLFYSGGRFSLLERKIRDAAEGNRCYVLCQKGYFILWIKILIACIPAAVIGLLFNDQIESLFYNYQTVAGALIVFGIAFIVIETRNSHKTAKVSRLSDIPVFVCIFHRCISADRGSISGNFPFRRNHCRSTAAWRFKNSFCGIYIFPCNSGNVWRQPFKTGPVRFSF